MERLPSARQPSQPPSRFGPILAIGLGSLLVAACSAPLPAPSNSAGTPATPTHAAAPTGSPADPTPSPSLNASPSPSLTASPDPLAARTIAEIAVPGGPDFPVAAFGSLWLLAPDGDEPNVVRLDPRTNEVVATIPVGGFRLCQAMGATDEAVWACTSDGVVRIDPEANEVVANIELPTAGFYGYFPTADGSLWVLSGQVYWPDTLMRVDPRENVIVETFELGFPATWISAGEGALWLTDTQGGRLWRFDLATQDLTEHASNLAVPGASAVGAGSLWLAVRTDRANRPTPTDVSLVRIAADTGQIEAEIATGGSLYDGMLHATDEAVWVRSADPFLLHIDPATNDVVEAFKANKAGGSVTVAFGSVWATSFDFHTVWRIQP